MTFTCVAAGNSIWLRSNGEQLDNGKDVFIKTELLDEAENIRISTLILWVSSPENATNITCHSSSVDPITFDNSRQALLLVQGRYCITGDRQHITACSRFCLISTVLSIQENYIDHAKSLSILCSSKILLTVSKNLLCTSFFHIRFSFFCRVYKNSNLSFLSAYKVINGPLLRTRFIQP